MVAIGALGLPWRTGDAKRRRARRAYRLPLLLSTLHSLPHIGCILLCNYFLYLANKVLVVRVQGATRCQNTDPVPSALSIQPPAKPGNVSDHHVSAGLFYVGAGTFQQPEP